jgi:flagellar assembly protein FliH
MKSLSSAVKRGRLLLEPYQLGARPERMISQSELDAILERERAEAFERGFEQGSSKGYELGEREGSQRAAEEVAARLKQEFADRLAALDGLIGEIAAARERLIRSAEREAVALAIVIASRVLAAEVKESSLSPELVEDAVRETMERKHVVVRLNPADRDALTQDGRPLEAMFPGAASVQFVTDESVSRCGCIVESNMGIVDAQLDTQLEQLRQALLGERAVQEPGEAQ